MAACSHHTNPIPYTSVYLDVQCTDILAAFKDCYTYHWETRQELCDTLISLFRSHNSNPDYFLPCLSVRTALDLWLTVQNFPAGSEIIVSALNIPDMQRIITDHGLKIIPLDVHIETMTPKISHLEYLITERTVAILLAHIFGKRFDAAPFIRIARRHKLCVVEDCAEAFAGFTWFGHPDADLSMFSFGAIKYYTAFGGAMVRVRDRGLYDRMRRVQNTYRCQTNTEYAVKLVKYSALYVALDVPGVIGVGMRATRWLNVDHQAVAVRALRGFPDRFYERLRQRCCVPLLLMMLRRLRGLAEEEEGVSGVPQSVRMSKSKGDYVAERLPRGMVRVGQQAPVNNYWLYPVLVDSPDEVLFYLKALGVDAYRGATQMNVILPEPVGATDAESTQQINAAAGTRRDSRKPATVVEINHVRYGNIRNYVTDYPHEARYLIDHVIYLPVNKLVPYAVLDEMVARLHRAMDICNQPPGLDDQRRDHAKPYRIKLKSKL